MNRPAGQGPGGGLPVRGKAQPRGRTVRYRPRVTNVQEQAVMVQVRRLRGLGRQQARVDPAAFALGPGESRAWPST